MNQNEAMNAFFEAEAKLRQAQDNFRYAEMLLKEVIAKDGMYEWLKLDRTALNYRMRELEKERLEARRFAKVDRVTN